MRLYSGLQATWTDFKPVAELRAAVAKIAPNDTVSEVGKAAKALVTTLDSIAGDSLTDARQVWDARPPVWSFVDLNGEFGIELTAQDNADHVPTRAALVVASSSCADLGKLVARWRQVVRVDLAAFNQLVLKAMFTGVALERIVGLSRRVNPELSRMARDYAAELATTAVRDRRT